MVAPSILAAAAILVVTIVLVCGGEEEHAVDSLLQLLPRNADTFTLLDLEEVRDERLDDLEDQIATHFDTDQLYEWGIDLDDIDALLLSDLDNADALTVLQGIFSTEDVADALDDAGYRDDVYRDIEIWVERRSNTAVALVAEDTIIIGEGERVEDSIDAFIGATRSIEQEDDVSEIVDSLGDALTYSVEENSDYRGCRRWARGVRAESGELVAVFIFAFRDEETASDADRDIDDDLEELGFEPTTDLYGSLVTATFPVEEEEFRLNRSAVLDFTSREGEEPPVEQRPAPAAPRVADDHSDIIAGATRISVGDRLNGDIEHEGDVDLFSFRARSGYYYTIRVRHGTNPDTILTLLDSDGRFITEDDDSGGDGEPWLEWAAPSSGIYYVEVRGFDGDATGTYRIEVDESDPEPVPAPTAAPAPPRVADDHSDIIAGATRISLGDTLNGDIEHEGDIDLFSFRARSGYYYTIRVHHGTNPDTILTLLDSDGRLITEDDDSGGDGEPRLEWAAPSTGNYYVEVRGFDGDATGTYRIELDELDPEPVPAPQPTLAPTPTAAPVPAATSAAPTPTAAPVPAATSAPAATPAPKADPDPTATPFVVVHEVVIDVPVEVRVVQTVIVDVPVEVRVVQTAVVDIHVEVRVVQTVVVEKQVEVIKVIEKCASSRPSDGTPTQTPTPVPPPTPSPTPVPPPLPTPSPTPVPIPTTTPSPTPLPTPTPTPVRPTATPVPTLTPTVTPTPYPTHWPTPIVVEKVVYREVPVEVVIVAVVEREIPVEVIEIVVIQREVPIEIVEIVVVEKEIVVEKVIIREVVCPTPSPNSGT